MNPPRSPHARATDTSTAVDALMRGLAHPHKPAIETLRRAILATDPSIAEGVKWNAPSFRTREYFATVHLRAKTGERLARAGATVSAKAIALDGPFGETKELVGGYWFAVAPSLEDAASLLSTSPTLPCGLFYEVRPLEPERASASGRSNETPD